MTKASRRITWLIVATLTGLACLRGTLAAQAQPAGGGGLPRVQSGTRRGVTPAQRPRPVHGRTAGVIAIVPDFYPVIYGEDTTSAPAAARAGTKVIEVAPGPGGEIMEVQRLPGDTLRLTRPATGSTIATVRLFLADSLQHVLAEQTFQDAPYSAVFPVSPRTAFVGATVTYTSGASSTTLQPYVPTR
ncbi:MAG: hypothetical protein ACREOJ_01810 [Gemmatimonadaceae bacterium]